jgi:hypothetical protein
MKKQKLNLPTTCFLLLAFSFLLTTGMQCKKSSETPKEVLPAETQTGKGTFGCLVNGEVWLPIGKSFIPALSTTIQFNILSIHTNRNDENLVFGIRSVLNIGEYNLKKNDNLAEFSIGSVSYKCKEGIMTITKYDKTTQIISGTFSLTAQNDNGEIINITEGRFDDKYTN